MADLKLREFIFRGTIEYRGANFFVVAFTKAEAVAQAKAGDFQEIDVLGAEMINWEVDPRTIESNE